jgi:hypothetical protein
LVDPVRRRKIQHSNPFPVSQISVPGSGQPYGAEQPGRHPVSDHECEIKKPVACAAGFLEQMLVN